MAIAVQSVSTLSWDSHGTTSTITKPTGLAVGDLMIAHLGGTQGYPFAGSFSAPAGWADSGASLQTASDSGQNSTFGSQAFYKIATSDDAAAANFAFTHASMVTAGAIFRIDGHNAVTPIDDANGGAAEDGGAMPSFATTITPTYANEMFLILAGSNNGSTSQTVSGYALATSNPSWTEKYDLQYSSNTSVVLAGASATRTETTATGNSTYTLDAGGAEADDTVIVIAIRPLVSVTVSADVVTATVAVQAPTVQTGVVVSPNAISATVTLNAPTIKENVTEIMNVQKSAAPTIANVQKHE